MHVYIMHTHTIRRKRTKSLIRSVHSLDHESQSPGQGDPLWRLPLCKWMCSADKMKQPWRREGPAVEETGKVVKSESIGLLVVLYKSNIRELIYYSCYN